MSRDNRKVLQLVTLIGNISNLPPYIPTSLPPYSYTPLPSIILHNSMPPMSPIYITPIFSITFIISMPPIHPYPSTSRCRHNIKRIKNGMINARAAEADWHVNGFVLIYINGQLLYWVTNYRNGLTNYCKGFTNYRIW